MLPKTLAPAAVDNATVRELERSSIREFVQSCSEQLTGRVLDYGCGKQPYRDIVETAGGDYHGFDRADFPANVSGEDVGEGFWPTVDFDAILCNQVLQYIPLYEAPTPLNWSLLRTLAAFFQMLGGGLSRAARPERGYLVLTYPTTWAEVEPADLTRFTAAGMHDLLTRAGFTIIRHEQRAHINLGGFRLPLGYGVLARA